MRRSVWPRGRASDAAVGGTEYGCRGPRLWLTAQAAAAVACSSGSDPQTSLPHSWPLDFHSLAVTVTSFVKRVDVTALDRPDVL